MYNIATSPLARILNKIKEKTPFYLATSVMVVGSTLGTINAANAATIELTDGQNATFTTINEATDVVDFADNGTTANLAISAGDVTMATLGNTGAGNIVFTISDSGTAGSMTVTGVTTVSQGNLTIVLSDDATTASFGGHITESNSKVALIQANDTDIVAFTGTGSNIDAKIDGVADGEGTMNVSGTVTFDDALGSVKELKALNVSGVSTFKAAADVEAVAITANATFEAALKADTISVTDSVLTINAATIDTDAGSETLVLTLNDTAGTGQVTFANGAAVSHTGTIVAAANTEGKVLVAVGSGAVGDLQTFTSTIGAAGTAVGEVAVGTSSLAGNADFEGAVVATAFNVVGGDHTSENTHVDIGAALTATDITLTTASVGDAEINVTGAVTVTGAIQGAGAGAGDTILDIDNDVTFASAVGTTTAIDKLEQIDAKTTTFQADVGITNIALTDGGAVTFDAAAAQTFTGAITAADVQEGTVTNGNDSGLLTFDGAIGTDANRMLEITAIDGATTQFNNAIFTKTLDLDTNGETTTLVTSGHFIGTKSGNAGALEIVAGAVIELGQGIGAGDTVFDVQTTTAGVGGVAIAGDITIKPAANFVSGTVVLIEGDFASVSAAEKADILVQDTALTDYVVDDGGGTATHDIGITAVKKSATQTGTDLSLTANSGTAAHQLMTAIASDSTELTLLLNSLGAINGKTVADATKYVAQAAPQTDLISGSSVAAQAVTGSIQGIMSNRMASLRSGDAYFGTGVAAGGMSAQSGFIQVFGSTAEQKSTKVGPGTQAGFDSDTQGLAIGFDGVTDSGMTIGVSVATANTDVDGKGAGKSVNSIDTYSAALYMDRATDAGYVEGSLTFGVNENSTSRKITSAGTARTLTGSYDSQSFSLNLTAGVPNEVGAGYLTPFGSFSASSMNIDAYTEKSTVASDPLRLKVAQDDVNSMVGTVGLKYHAEMDNGGMPMISLAINNEFGDSTIDSNNTFQGGGTVFKTTTAVEELSATLGLGYTYGTDAAAVEFAYEADANDDKYLSHYGSIKIVGKF